MQKQQQLLLKKVDTSHTHTVIVVDGSTKSNEQPNGAVKTSAPVQETTVTQPAQQVQCIASKI